MSHDTTEQEVMRSSPPPLPTAASNPPAFPQPEPQVENSVTVDARFQLALMALNARRYDEAVQRFTEILSVSPSPQVWLGLGASKIGAFMAGTVAADELVFCFRQAKLSGSEADLSLTYTAFCATVDDFLAIATAILQEIWSCESSVDASRRSGMLAIGVSCFTSSSKSFGTALRSADLLNQGANRMAEGRAIRQNVEESKRTLYSRLVAIRSAIQQVLPANHPSLLKAIADVDRVIVTLYPQAQASGPTRATAGTDTRQTAAHAGPTATSGFAIASLVCGILSVGIIPLFVPAIILGHLARSRIKKAEGTLGGGRLAAIGLSIGYAIFAIFAFFMALSILIAIPPR